MHAMTRLQTTQGTLARRGFLDAAAALEALADWHADQEVVLDLVVRSAGELAGVFERFRAA